MEYVIWPNWERKKFKKNKLKSPVYYMLKTN